MVSAIRGAIMDAVEEQLERAVWLRAEEARHPVAEHVHVVEQRHGSGVYVCDFSPDRLAAHTTLGLVEIAGAKQTVDIAEIGTINPNR